MVKGRWVAAHASAAWVGNRLKTLRAFCDAGLTCEILADGSKSYFNTRTDDHPHFFWEDSAKLADAPADQFEIARQPKAPQGSEVSKFDVVIRLRRIWPHLNDFFMSRSDESDQNH